MKYKFASLTIMLYIECSHGWVLQRVYCENLDTKKWYWLYDKKEKKKTVVRGTWEFFPIKGYYGFEVKSLRISKNDMERLYVSCQSQYGYQYAPHPASSIYDSWFLFNYREKDTMFFSQGTYTKQQR